VFTASPHIYLTTFVGPFTHTQTAEYIDI